MAVASLKPKDNGWKASEVLRRKAVEAIVMAEAILRMK